MVVTEMQKVAFFGSFDPTFEKKKSKINTKTKCVEQSINNKEMVQIYHEKKKRWWHCFGAKCDVKKCSVVKLNAR